MNKIRVIRQEASRSLSSFPPREITKRPTLHQEPGPQQTLNLSPSKIRFPASISLNKSPGGG